MMGIGGVYLFILCLPHWNVGAKKAEAWAKPLTT